MKLTILILLASALFVGACGGQSKADKAKGQVCDARADIQTQVKKLQGLTPATVTLNGVKDSEGALVVRSPDGVSVVLNDCVFNMDTKRDVFGWLFTTAFDSAPGTIITATRELTQC